MLDGSGRADLREELRERRVNGLGAQLSQKIEPKPVCSQFRLLKAEREKTEKQEANAKANIKGSEQTISSKWVYHYFNLPITHRLKS